MALHSDRITADIAVIDGQRRLVLRAAEISALKGFDGTRHDAGEDRILEGPLSHGNAVALRESFPHLRPVPLGTSTSAGVGDRLGLATAGHAGAFLRHGQGVTPVFAQQSIREMDRLDRAPHAVLDDATFGCVEAGWTKPVGADLDHIRTVGDIDRGIDAGFTTFTLDPGDAVRVIAPDEIGVAVEATNWQLLEDDAESAVRRYAGVTVDLGTKGFTPTEDEVRRAIAKYGDAIALTTSMSRHLAARASTPYEIEVAIDETAEETSLFEHHYLAGELERLGVKWVSMAPRYPDGFEKGVEYLGDAQALAESFAAHHAIAELHGGYKISMHSGSDKFSVYASLVEATNGRIHLKTSGTSWLVALDVVARRNPSLFREIHRLSMESYRQSRASYQVSADAAHVLDAETVADGDLPALVTEYGTRQILHVGYGTVLTAADHAGHRAIAEAISAALIAHRDEYAMRLQTHIGRHLAPFSEGAAS